MIKFYVSAEKWQFSFFHPESLCNKKIGFVRNDCEAPLSSSKNFVKNSDQFKALAQKLTKLDHFTVYLPMFSMKISQILDLNVWNFFWVSSVAIDIELDDFESSQFGS